MTDLVSRIRDACAAVAEQARHVVLEHEVISLYAATLPLDRSGPTLDPDEEIRLDEREQLAAYWLTLDAINFGSGWFPTLRKRPGRSGYFTVAAGVRDRFEQQGPWSADALREITATEIAAVLGQDSEHELMALFATSLRDLGTQVADRYDGSFGGVVSAAGSSAVAMAEELRTWPSFEDVSRYGEVIVPFFKRAQIAAADVARARLTRFDDLHRLTMFADNLVPHVLRIDGVLAFAPELTARIEREELIEHGSREEVEIRACALHAVELIVSCRPGTFASELDQLLWRRGQLPRYKATPRHRSRTTAY